MACSPVATSLMTRSGTSMSVPMAGCCEPREQSMMAASGTTCHNLKTAVPAHSSNDARAHRSRRSRVISTRMPQSCPFTEGHAGVRAIEQCTQKSRDAFCTSEGPARLRAYGLTRSHRRTRRVSPRRHCAEPQDNGAASTRPANRWSAYVNCVRGSAGRFRVSLLDFIVQLPEAYSSLGCVP